MIKITNLSRQFDTLWAVKNLSFQIQGGEIFGLLGPNGAGKSTLMKIIAGIVKQDSGSVLIKGSEVSIHNARHAIKLGISMIHQELMPEREMPVAETYIWEESR